MTRSLTQNRALHKLFEWAADEVNATGLTLRQLVIDVDIPVTPQAMKEYWRACQIAVTGKQSTTELESGEVDKVFAVFARALADKGVPITFPSTETRSEFFEAMDMAENLNYPVFEGDPSF